MLRGSAVSPCRQVSASGEWPQNAGTRKTRCRKHFLLLWINHCLVQFPLFCPDAVQHSRASLPLKIKSVRPRFFRTENRLERRGRQRLKLKTYSKCNRLRVSANLRNYQTNPPLRSVIYLDARGSSIPLHSWKTARNSREEYERPVDLRVRMLYRTLSRRDDGAGGRPIR